MQSDIFVPDKKINNTHIVQKNNNVVEYETPVTPPAKAVNQNNSDTTERRNFGVKSMLHRVVNWALDETFYTGVMNQRSFIRKLSKTLTG